MEHPAVIRQGQRPARVGVPLCATGMAADIPPGGKVAYGAGKRG